MSASQSVPAYGGGMPCPRCHIDLLMSERQGIEIDYCPKCRGVWLDRGELDKLIERSEQQVAAAPAPQYQAPPQPPPAQGPSPWMAPQAPQPGWSGRHHDDDDDDDDRRGYGRRHRRKSWLGELFD